MLRAAGTGSQGPAPGRAGPLSGNAKPEVWLPDLRRCSWGSRPVCCSLPKMKDTSPASPPFIPSPPAPQTRFFFARCLSNEERGMRRHSIAQQCWAQRSRWSSTEPSPWPLVVDSRLVAWPGGSFLSPEPGPHCLLWGNLFLNFCCRICPLLTLPFLHMFFLL